VPVQYFRNRPTDQDAPHRDTIQDPIQTLDTPGIIQAAQIFDRARERYKWAVNALGISCYLYRKLTQGRTCSCTKKDNIPAGLCPICYSTGYVGGYLQYGHQKYVLDATSPRLELSNLEIADGVEDLELRPSPIVLERDNFGYVESGEDVEINGALSYDGYALYYDLPPRQGGQVNPFFWDGRSWQPLSTFQAFLESLGVPPWTLKTRFRIEMNNNSANGEIPCLLQGLHVKWRVADDLIQIDQATYDPVRNKLTDLGFVDATSGLQYTTTYRPRISTRDFLVKVSDGTRLKVTVAKMGDPADQPLWQDLSLRPIQEDAEILSKVF
jgi:hypothetical protein